MSSEENNFDAPQGEVSNSEGMRRMSKRELKKVGKTSAAELKKLPNVKAVVTELEGKGITADKLATKLNDGLEATRPVVADGEILEYAPDYPTRFRYAELLLKVRGDMRDIKDSPEKNTVNVQVNIVDMAERIALLGVKVERPE